MTNPIVVTVTEQPDSPVILVDVVELRGEVGPGVAPGGVPGQALGKASADDYDTEWFDVATQVELDAVTDSVAAVSSRVTVIEALGSLATDAELTAAISGLTAVYQPLNAQLTAIAGLTTTAYGRGLLLLANQAALLTAVGSATEVQAGVVELATIAEALAGVDTTTAVTPAGVKAAFDELIAGAPGMLNTLDELAAALGDDANFATNVLANIATKVAKAGDTMTGVLQVVPGSAAVPGLAFSGDTDTGIFSPGANQLALSSAGVQVLNVSNGGVFFGAPGGNSQPLILNGGGVGGQSAIYWNNEGSGAWLQYLTGDANPLYLRDVINSRMHARYSAGATTDLAWTGFESRFRIGINSAPIAQLDVFPSVATRPGLLVRGFTAQTANLIDVQNSGGASMFFVDPAGQTVIGSLGGMSTTLGVMPLSTATTGLVVRGKASQTANLTEWQNSTGLVIGAVTSVGNSLFRKGHFGSMSDSNPNVAISALALSANYPAVIAKAFTGQSSAIFEIQNSDALPYVRFNTISLSVSPDLNAQYTKAAMYYSGEFKSVSGYYLNIPGPGIGTDEWLMYRSGVGASPLYIRDATNARMTASFQHGMETSIVNYIYGRVAVGRDALSDLTAALNVMPSSAVYKGIAIRGFASQTADLQQWQDSTGTNLGSVSATGHMVMQRVQVVNDIITPSITDTAVAGPYITLDSTKVSVLARTAGQVALTVKAAVAQTASLQEWQDSAGVVKVNISPNGSINLANAVQAVYYGDTGFIGPYLTAQPSYLRANARNASQIPFYTMGFAGQTVDLFQARNDAGTPLFKVTAAGGVGVANGSTPATPVAGGVIYVEAGALKYIGSSGTITTLAAA